MLPTATLRREPSISQLCEVHAATRAQATSLFGRNLIVTPAHTRLVEVLAAAEQAPEAPDDLARWLQGDAHLELLRRDAQNDELILAALSPRQTCINSYVVPANLPELAHDILSLEEWSPNPYHHTAANYDWELGDEIPRAIPRDGGGWRDLPAGVSPLVFFRSLEGLGSEDSVSREVAQDFIHASKIYWRDERKAYAKLDFRGDWADIVSRSTEDESAYADLFSGRREWIDLHLMALGAVLVRGFEFDLRRQSLPDAFNFSHHISREIRNEPTFQYRKKINEGNFGRIRGVQVIEPRRSPLEVKQLVTEGRIFDPAEATPIDFIVQDWRNRRVARVSTDPSTTTNYFEARQNSLPFETSPAFFRPEVLAKYKADSEKYTVRETLISCRASWELKYNVNDIGQIAVYICDLRLLPHEEQRYWATFNDEQPQAGLSARTIQTDFRGEWPEDMTPLEKLIIILQRWCAPKIRWWTWRAEGAPERLVVPRMETRDEWATEILTLSNGVVEGFVVEQLRQALRDEGAEFDKKWRSITLLEKILVERGVDLPGERLISLREVNEVRGVSGVHATSAKKKQKLATSALQQHGTYAAHFEYLCEGLATELTLIEQALGGK